LSEVSVIFVPQKSEEDRSYAYSIIKDLPKKRDQKVVGLVFPMKKDSWQLLPYWEKAMKKIWEYLSKGEDCAFIAEGDPFLYGTFVYIFEIFQEQHPEAAVEVVPGISSINASSARALLPLASNEERTAILPAPYENKALREVLENFDTIILLKVHKVFDNVLNTLEKMNLADKCVYVRRCTTENEEIVRDIRKLRGVNLDYFSLLIVRRQK
jgi:precorrin-2/cobalt-factor-2 C20-methyltransferase